MIASGLCLMGGCFAQIDTGEAMDTFWPAYMIEAPTTDSRVDRYFLPAIGTDEAQSGYMRAFGGTYGGGQYLPFRIICSADGSNILNAYALSNSHLEIDSREGDKLVPYIYASTMPDVFKIGVNVSGKEAWFDGYSLKVPVAFKTPDEKVVLHVLSTRTHSQFSVSFGNMGVRWYVQAMQSATGAVAVFDVEKKTLVEM